MSPNPLFGVLFHWLGGLASGSFYVPYKGVPRWSWETYWLAGGIFSWLIAPWAAGAILSNDLWAVLQETDSRTFWLTYLMGVLWGTGGLTFGLTMRYLGMSLGMAIALGFCAAFGTLIPPLVKGEFAERLLATTSGQMVFAGVGICLAGIAIGAIAGLRKEKEVRTTSESSVKEFDFPKGLLIATFSGIMSACFAFGFQFGEPISKLSAQHGTGPLWVGLPVLVVILLGGLTTNVVWCGILHVRNGSGREYFSTHANRRTTLGFVATEPGHTVPTAATGMEATTGRVPLIRNWFFCAVAGVTWYLQFFFYQMGESQMGDYRFSSWTLHMASIIVFSTLWGLYFREWRGVRVRTRMIVAMMLLTLVGSTVVIGWGNFIAGTPVAH